MSYSVQISPDAKGELLRYLLQAEEEYGKDTASKLIDGYEKCLDVLEQTPYACFDKLKYIPAKYKFFRIWKHYWAIFQIKEEKKVVIIDYVIDDRQNYGSFVH